MEMAAVYRKLYSTLSPARALASLEERGLLSQCTRWAVYGNAANTLCIV